MDLRPIGIFDSGLGGLTVLKEIRKALPNEDVVYLGDTARVPYGTRSKKTIEKFSLQCAYFLAGKGVKCIVVACNTSSSNAIKKLRKQIDIPLFDVVESSLRGVIENSCKSAIVIGTNATINSHAHKRLLINKKVLVKQEIACPLLVPLVENGEINSLITKLVIKKYLSNTPKADCIILGCTHYPLLKSVISEVLSNKFILIDPAVYLAKTVKKYLNENNMSSDIGGKISYFVTDYSETFNKTAEIFLGEPIGSSTKQVELA